LTTDIIGSRMARRTKSIDQKQVDKWTALWVQRLKLNDWTIDAQLVDRVEEPPDEIMETAGACSWDPDRQYAWIQVIQDPDPYEVESTLVHELVHIVQRGHEAPTEYKWDVNEERSVNKLTEALMQGYKK
jgi:hypothetical protein